MKEQRQIGNFCITAGLLVLFGVWTAAACHIDLQAIGPKESVVGFATLNRAFHELTGVHWVIYAITDWLGLVPLGFILCFALLGFVQLIKRKSFFKVDADILLLGGFYVIVMAAYVLFEILVINYRPVLIEGALEASYPSSTTMLVMCVMPTAIIQFNSRIKDSRMKRLLSYVMVAFTVFMVMGRLVSGVHWITDIVGGILLSTGLVRLYFTIYMIRV